MITAYLATFKGREVQIRKTIASIAKQVDMLRVYANDYDEEMIRKLLIDTPINVSVSTGENIGDVGKFIASLSWQDYVFTIDDDIVYPDDYVARSIEILRELDHKSVISYHGRVLDLPIDSFFNSKAKYYPFYKKLSERTEINLLGTGCMAMHTDCLKKAIDSSRWPYTNMSDIFFSAELQKQDVKMFAVEHEANWIVQQRVDVTIADSQAEDDYLETTHANKLIKSIWLGKQ